jgi:purine-binding chemotaxis protein CheW
VREILWLPELTPLEETPGYVTGVLNLRGRIVPVIDLDARFGRNPPRYQLTDSLIVLEHEEGQVGIIVNEVQNVRPISVAEAETPSYGFEGEQRSRFLAGLARVDEQVVMLLLLENVIRLPEVIEALGGEEAPPLVSAERYFCPGATAEEREVFRERARSLAKPLEEREAAGRLPLAVARLNDEYIGIDLEVVREFAEVGAASRVPCCPPHVVGQVNLRGDIVTLVDIRGALQMPVAALREDGKLLVVQSGELLVGVPVDEVLDVLYLRPADVTSVPAAVEGMAEQYLQGTAPYEGKLLSILDLPGILAHGNLVVNEEP